MEWIKQQRGQPRLIEQMLAAPLVELAPEWQAAATAASSKNIAFHLPQQVAEEDERHFFTVKW